MKDFWNERYSKKEFAYGTRPNVFFKQELDKLNRGALLLPAEGEGRNAVYAAVNGWDVYASDISQEGKLKALSLAEENNTSISYEVNDFGAIQYDFKFDAAALIFAHFPKVVKEQYHRKVAEMIKPGGTLILELFDVSHLEYSRANPKVGGPKDIGMLASKEEVLDWYDEFETILCTVETVELDEGEYHQGTSSVIRYVGTKRST